ncbi:MAG: DUF5810 domain-containing protein, partial [Haloferacaceae archaeon]
MGYACPVCGEPQRDGEHLANHLAFTAMLGDDDHESWLDERAPGWDESTPAALADRVVEHATETEYEEVFEDTVHPPGHDHGDSRAGGSGRASDGTAVDDEAARRRGGADLDAEAQQVLQEARELTREMLTTDGDAADGDDGTVDGDAEANGAIDGDAEANGA